ncbi:cytochrome c biogenesis protein CcsA [bacterium]|nr:cytochrome c biogenesis protein CcsA [bacterium]
MIRKYYILLLSIVFFSAFNTFAQESKAGSPEGSALRLLKSLPIQNGGRVKPFDSFARETVRAVTNEHHWKGQEPALTLLDWASNPAKAYETELLPVDYEPLREAINLEAGRKYFSMQELMQNNALQRLSMQAMEVQQQGGERTIVEQKSVDLLNRVGEFQSVLTAESFTMVPIHGDDNGSWISIATIAQDSSEMTAGIRIAYSGMILSYKNMDWDIFAKSVKVLDEQIRNMGSSAIPAKRISAEVTYNSFKPFFWAKLLYVLAFALMMFTAAMKLKKLEPATYGLFIGGFLLHTFALLMRFWIGGRAPWSNMYESITTAAWGVMLFGLMPLKGYGRRFLMPAAALIGFFSLLITSHVSLDPAINPLVPALQSIWLNIHVIIILLGYAACTLAMGAGHVWIGYDLFKPQDRSTLAGISQAIYRMFQFAVLFLVVGIILGSVWAQSAWGRYWGWDPKETWALITWFFYLALIHATSTGWLKQRGIAIASLAGFLLMLITYYGVNYYLAGLHSYAQGEAVGVPPMIAAFFILEVIIMVAYWLYTRSRDQRMRAARKSATIQPT